MKVEPNMLTGGIFPRLKICCQKNTNWRFSSVENGSVEWEESSALIYSAIREAAIQAKNDGELAAEAAQTFIRFVTEEPGCAGMLPNTVSENLRMCLAFFRRIGNINLEHAQVGAVHRFEGDYRAGPRGQGCRPMLA